MTSARTSAAAPGAIGANLASDGLLAIPAIVAAAGLELLAVRAQRVGGRLEPNADERGHQKALFLVRRARRERGGTMPWQP